MYEEINIDGKIIKIKRVVPVEETGVVIKRDELEDTIDLKDKLGEITDGTK